MKTGVFLIIVLTLGALIMDEAKADLTALLPVNIDGWKVSAKDQIYNRDNLYDYINGGAELYLSFGFKNVISRTYSKSGQPNIIVDIFDMVTSRDAFGVFSISRETVDKTFGQGSQYTEGLLLFWKNNYYVSILSSPETAESKKAVFNLARKIEASVPEEGPLPQIVALLPNQSLVRESIRYFRHYIWLNSLYFISSENILHISDKTDAVLAKYGKKGERYILLILKYRNNADAKLGYNDFVKYYLPELSGKSAVKIEDNTWTGSQIKGDFLIIVFNAPTEYKALNLMEAVQKNILSM